MKNYEKWDKKLNHLSVFGWAMLFSCPVLGRMLAWQLCDVTNIMWCKTLMAQKSDRERGGDGKEWGRGGACWALEYRFMEREKEKKGWGRWGRGGMNGKTGVPGGKKTLVRCSRNPMILILMRVSLPPKLRQTKPPPTTTKRERATHAHIHSTHTHTHTIGVLW